MYWTYWTYFTSIPSETSHCKLQTPGKKKKKDSLLFRLILSFIPFLSFLSTTPFWRERITPHFFSPPFSFFLLSSSSLSLTSPLFLPFLFITSLSPLPANCLLERSEKLVYRHKSEFLVDWYSLLSRLFYSFSLPAALVLEVELVSLLLYTCLTSSFDVC